VKRYGLIGYPLGHSFSRKYFEEKFEREGIRDAAFHLFPIESIDQLSEIISSHPDLLGLSVTIPHKKTVLRYLHALELPEGLTACNCIKIDGQKLTGYNTDVIGFENSFTAMLRSHHRRALVLGNGGAAEAVIHVLNKLNIEHQVVSRKLHEGSHLTYADIGRDVIERHQIIINTTPLGTYPNIHEYPDIPYQYLSSGHYLYDLVYNPSKTAFLEKGERMGACIRNGSDMLAIQAEASWKIWNAPRGVVR
jgi:shikimate dehydrogenase